MKRLLCARLALLLPLGELVAAEPQQNALALTNVTVIDTTGSRPGQLATVLITRDVAGKFLPRKALEEILAQTEEAVKPK